MLYIGNFVWIIVVGAVITATILMLTIILTLVGCVVFLKHHKRCEQEAEHQEIELFEMTQNAVYESPIQIINNNAYGQIGYIIKH